MIYFATYLPSRKVTLNMMHKNLILKNSDESIFKNFYKISNTS